MLAIIPFVVCLTSLFFHYEVPPAKSTTAAEDSEEAKYFGICNVIAVVIVFYLWLMVSCHTLMACCRSVRHRLTLRGSGLMLQIGKA
ncbi:Nodulin-like [Sesbania bispinosa]|nr:Nodulin-like [Sesbania bispinosa]